MNWYLEPLKRIFDWRGRATRKEYWLFYLMGPASCYILSVALLVIQIRAGAISSAEDYEWSLLSYALAAYIIAITLACIALTVRRFHDIDKSAWHLLWFFFPIPLVGFIYWLGSMCTEGTSGNNRYGPNPQPNPEAPQAAPSQDLKPLPLSSESNDGPEQTKSTETTTSVTEEDPQVAELREQLAAAEAAAAAKAATNRLQERRTQLIERIHGLEEAVMEAENKLNELKNSDDSS